MAAPLSDRLSPGVECAPWVIEEIKKIEARLATMTELLEAAKLAEGVAQRVISMTGFDESRVADWRPRVRTAIWAAEEDLYASKGKGNARQS